MEATSLTQRRSWALAAAGSGFAILALYIGIIIGQGDIEWGPVAVVVAFIVTGSGAALAGAVIQSVRLARWLLRVAAVVFGVLGVLALFSIGILLIAVSVLAVVAVARLDPDQERSNG